MDQFERREKKKREEKYKKMMKRIERINNNLFLENFVFAAVPLSVVHH